MKIQTADDIYPAKCWWLRRKRLYPAFVFSLFLSLFWSCYSRGQHKCLHKRNRLFVNNQDQLRIVAIALDDGNYFVFPRGHSASQPPIVSSLLATHQQAIIKVFSGGSVSVYYPLWVMSLESGYSNWKEMRPFQFVPLSAAPALPLSQDKKQKQKTLWNAT